MKSLGLRLKIRVFILLLVTGLVAGVLWKKSPLVTQTSSLSPPPSTLPLVFVQTVEKERIHDLLTYPARIEPKVSAKVLSDIDGIVEKIYRPLGSSVKRNQVILKLKNVDPLYDYAPVWVRSTIEGTVSEVTVTEGSQVTKGTSLLRVVDSTQILMTSEIAASDLSSIEKGMQGTFELHSPHQSTQVKVAGISPSIDPMTRSSQVRLVPLSPTPGLQIGQSGRLLLKVRNHLGFQVPLEAVTYREEAPHLRLVKDQTIELQPVVLGPTRRGQVEITQGLSGGEKIVVRASVFLKSGEKVEVQKLDGGKYSE